MPFGAAFMITSNASHVALLRDQLQGIVRIWRKPDRLDLMPQQGMDGYCKGLGHDTLTEAQRKHYGDEHRCAVYTGAMGSINMLLTLMLLVTYLIGLTGSCMVGCGGDGAYGYEEEGDEESK